MLKDDGLPVEYHCGCCSKGHTKDIVVAMDGFIVTVLWNKLTFSIYGDGAVLKLEAPEVVERKLVLYFLVVA